MTSKISFRERLSEFRAVIRWEMKKNAGMAVLLGALQFLCMPLILLLQIPRWEAGSLEFHASAATVSEQYENELKLVVPAFVLTISLLFAILFCARLFGYMQNRRSVDLYHALPVGRGPMFLGRWCTGAVLLSVPTVLNFGITVWIAAANGISTASQIGRTFQGMGWILLFSAAAFTFCSFFMVCSGSVMNAFLSVLGVNVGFPLAVYCAGNLIGSTVPGMAGAGKMSWPIMTLLAPFPAAYLPFGSGSIAALFLPWWLCLTAALLIGAFLFYKKRASESAENQFAFPVPKIAVRFLLTVCGGLILGLLVGQGRLLPFLTGVAAGSLAAHTAVEASYSRGFKGLGKSFRWYAVFAVCFAVFYGAVATGLFGYDTAVPEESQIQSVSVQTLNCNGLNYVIADGRRIRLQPRLKQPESIRTALKAQRSISGWYRSNRFPYTPCSVQDDLTITYFLKNGRTFTRSYGLFPEYGNGGKSSGGSAGDLQRYAESLPDLPEYCATADLINYVGPQDLSSVWISSAGKSEEKKRYLLSGKGQPLARELIEALQSEPVGAASSLSPKTPGIPGITLDYGSDIVPSAALNEVLGGKYSHVSGASAFYYYRKGGKVDGVLQKIVREIAPNQGDQMNPGETSVSAE